MASLRKELLKRAALQPGYSNLERLESINELLLMVVSDIAGIIEKSRMKITRKDALRLAGLGRDSYSISKVLRKVTHKINQMRRVGTKDAIRMG